MTNAISTHTPTPWRVSNGTTGRYRSPTTTIAVDHASGVEQTVATMAGISASKADAAHIVRCVNSHDALVAALRALLDENTGGSHGLPAYHADVIAARAALAKVEG
jgi:hypothetical protein